MYHRILIAHREATHIVFHSLFVEGKMQRANRLVFQQTRRLSKIKDHDVVVVSFARTPIGKMNGGLASLTAPQVSSYCVSSR
jgi:hypothetical protein